MIVLGPGPSLSISMAGRVESRLTVPAERAGSKLHRATLPSAWPETQQVWVQALDNASLCVPASGSRCSIHALLRCGQIQTAARGSAPSPKVITDPEMITVEPAPLAARGAT